MKLFVWDLHGTLEQGNDRLVIDISNEVLARRGYAQRFSHADSPALYGRPWEDYFRWLLGGNDPARDASLRQDCIALADADPGRRAATVTPTPHAHDVLRAVAGARHDQVLISSSRTETVQAFTAHLGYQGFFPPGHALATAGPAPRPPEPKKAALAGYLQARGPYDEIVITGDTPGDMNLAEVAGGTTYLFARPGTPFPDCPARHRIRDLRHVLASL